MDYTKYHAMIAIAAAVLTTIAISSFSMLHLQNSDDALAITPTKNSTLAASNMNMTAQSSNSTSNTSNKTFYIFSAEVDTGNFTVGIPNDIYSLPIMVVNKGDSVTVHFFNVDKGGSPHTFTIDAPYNINKDIRPGQNATATFTANQTGIFWYYCKYHEPAMKGELVVLP